MTPFCRLAAPKWVIIIVSRGLVETGIDKKCVSALDSQSLAEFVVKPGNASSATGFDLITSLALAATFELDSSSSVFETAYNKTC